MDLDTGELEMVSTGKGGCTCAFYHPNGQKIIFASSHHGPYADEPPPDDETAGYKWAFDKHMDVFEANIDGTNLRRLTTTPGYDAECSYSSDGKRIVFVSERDDDLEIYVMNSDGTDQMRFTNAEGYDGGPFFSPDGKTILYRGDHRDDDEMNLQLRIINADGTNDRAITDNPIFNWCPYWHTDGESFIFTQVDHAAWARGKPPNYDLFMMTPEGEKFTRITYDKDFDGLPVFSPDGTRLLWTSKRGGLDEAQVFIAEFTLPEQLR
jgi:Tol biopolymer transport system component